jgi:16S rRNA processing protein RimM
VSRVRVAALYDVHGNLPALDAVLEDLPVDAHIVLGGDVVVGPFPAETLSRLRALGDRVSWIRGNADRELMPGEGGNAPHEVLDWVRSRLDDGEIAFLHELPQTLILEVQGLGRVLFCHATPRNDVDVFTEVTPEERLGPYFADVDADVVVCGHTHMQFDRTIGGRRVINAGSVGWPYEDTDDAYWLLLGPGVEHRQTPYERDLGDYIEQWPTLSRREATELFERVYSSDKVAVGKVGRSHGLEGAFVVEDASEDPDRFAVGVELYVGGEPARVVESKRAGGRPVVRLDRRGERGATLEIPREALGLTREGEYYVFQLVGLEVIEEGGRELGRVTAVEPYEANDVLELDSGLLLPMVEDCIREVDRARGRIIVAPGFADAG